MIVLEYVAPDGTAGVISSDSFADNYPSLARKAGMACGYRVVYCRHLTFEGRRDSLNIRVGSHTYKSRPEPIYESSQGHAYYWQRDVDRWLLSICDKCSWCERPIRASDPKKRAEFFAEMRGHLLIRKYSHWLGDYYCKDRGMVCSQECDSAIMSKQLGIEPHAAAKRVRKEWRDFRKAQRRLRALKEMTR